MQLSFGKGLTAGAAGAAILVAITVAASGAGAVAAANHARAGDTSALSRADRAASTSARAGAVRADRAASTSARAASTSALAGAVRADRAASTSAPTGTAPRSPVGPAVSVLGGGRMKAAQTELKVGKSATLLRLPPYGKFTVSCVTASLAELDFVVGRHPVREWIQDTTLTSSAVSEQYMPAGSSLGFQTGAPEQFNYTIQNATSSGLNTHLATAQGVEMTNGHVCDFAVTAFAGP